MFLERNNFSAKMFLRRYNYAEISEKCDVKVDFYVPGENLGIQVSYSLRDFDTRERESGALVKMKKAFSLQRMMIITMDEEETIGIGDASIYIWNS